MGSYSGSWDWLKLKKLCIFLALFCSIWQSCVEVVTPSRLSDRIRRRFQHAVIGRETTYIQ